MEENKSIGESLFKEIVEGLKKGNDVDVRAWADDGIFNMFDDEINEAEELMDENTKKKIMETLIELCPTFFNDKRNIIYLKLLNLYEMNLEKKGEDQELYYITNVFTPLPGELRKVMETLRSIKERVLEDVFKKFYESRMPYADAMDEFWQANEFGKKLLTEIDDEHDDYDDIECASRLLDELDKLYTEEYVFEMVKENRFDEFENKFLSSKKMELPLLYCSVNGSSFSNDEKNVMAAELDKVQQELLSTAIESRGKK